MLYLTRQAAEPPLSPGSLLYVLYVIYLTRQAAEPPLSPSSLLYVLYVLYILYACYIGPYSTCSTYSKERGESGCSVGCLVRYSTYSTYSPQWVLAIWPGDRFFGRKRSGNPTLVRNRSRKSDLGKKNPDLGAGSAGLRRRAGGAAGEAMPGRHQAAEPSQSPGPC